MLGLEAISAHNGWAMAITGTIIVMCGLSALAFIISQLHKIIALFEKRKDLLFTGRTLFGAPSPKDPLQ